MAKGAITRIVHDQGYGFIQPSDNTEDVLFRRSCVDDEHATFDNLHEGMTVEFELEADPQQANESRATHVRLSSRAYTV